ncbi:MAG: ABC transporter permease, partial [Actinomycetia bacterium]|nr:ABC transporter permease [Actinomycetes bacterium]
MTTQQQTAPAAPPRTQALRRFVRAYAQRPAGLVGLGVLLAFAVLALTAPLYIGPEQLDVTNATGDRLAPPSSDYLLGTDESGRSILMLVIWGSRASLTIGVIATAMTMLIGSVIGLLAGHYQGWFGSVLMRIT